MNPPGNHWSGGREVERLIEYMRGKGGVWFATMEEIAAHVLACAKDGAYSPRIDRPPSYREPVVVRPAPTRPPRAAE